MNTWPEWSKHYLIPALVVVVVGATGFAVGANYRSSDEVDSSRSFGPSSQSKDQLGNSPIDSIEATLTAGQTALPSPTPAAVSTNQADLPRSSAPRPAPPANPGLININQANASQLESLPGIGPVKAKAIIDYRQTNGPFIRVDDLLKVKGIGPKTLESIKPRATL